MGIEAIAAPGAANVDLLGRRALGWLMAAALRLAIAASVLGAWAVSRGGIYTPASGLGYWLGVVGGCLMLALLVYPLRKRFRVLSFLGPLRHWFRFHLLAGIAGPLIILFHSTFHIGSFNAAIALASMLLVVASGIVGRYIYRKIHNGLYGSRASAAELQGALKGQMEALGPLLARFPVLEQEVGRFSALVSLQPAGRLESVLHFTTLGWKRFLAGRRVRRAIQTMAMEGNGQSHLQSLALSIDGTLKAVQRSAQFSTYEKIFSLWHVIHIPFLCMLLVTAVIHVVAVHAY